MVGDSFEFCDTIEMYSDIDNTLWTVIMCCVQSKVLKNMMKVFRTEIGVVSLGFVLRMKRASTSRAYEENPPYEAPWIRPK